MDKKTILTQEEGSWDNAFHEDDPLPPKTTSVLGKVQEPGEEWYAQWDPVDNGKAGPIRMKIFWLCALPGLLQFLCGSLFLPALSSINEDYEPTAFESTATISFYSFLSGVVPIIWGPISDKFSRKWVLVGNLLVYGILNYLNAWNNTIWGIIIFRALIAIPLSAFFVCVTGILSDIFREKERAFWLGIRNLPGFLSVLLAPPIGGVFVYFMGWRITAIIQAALGIISMIIILFMLPETLNKEQAKRATLNPLGPILIMLHPRILPNALIQGLGFGAMYMTVAAVPLTFPVYYNASIIVIGLSLVPFAVGSALGAVCGGITTNILKKYIGHSGTLFSALFWNITTLPAFIGWGYTLEYNIWLPIFFSGLIAFLRNATTPPTLMFCINEFPNQSSAVNGGLLAVQFVFGSVITLIFPPLVADYGYSWGILMTGLSASEFLCFIPLLYLAYQTFRNTPLKPEGAESDPLLTSSVNPTNSLSGAQREYRDSSIGYISDSSEFLR